MKMSLAIFAMTALFSFSAFAGGDCDPNSQQAQTESCQSVNPPAQPNPCDGKNEGDQCGTLQYNGAYSGWEYGYCMSGPPSGALECAYGG